MKVLWVCNIMLPVIAEALHKEASNKEGWLSGLLEQVAAENSSDLELAVAFPVPADTEVPWRLQIAMPWEKEDREHLQTNTDAEIYNITCYGFHEDTVHPDRYQPLLEEELHRITEDFSPDVIHCFGTEYPHTGSMPGVSPQGEDTGGNSGNLYVVCGGIFCRYAGIGDPQDHFPGSGEEGYPAQPAGKICPQRCNGEGSNRTCRQYHRKNRLGQGSDYRVESQGTLLYDE